MAGNTVIQITDLHFGATVGATLAGVNPVDSFNAVLDALDKNGHAEDILLLSGDLSGGSYANSYRILNQLLRDRNKKVIWLPGNHDDLELMKRHLSDYPIQLTSYFGDWAVVTLDSSQFGTPSGYVNNEKLSNLEKRLTALTDRSVLIAMHHCPIPLGSYWLDKQRINNSEDLYKILSSRDNVRGVVTGHVHQQFDGFWGDFPLFTTPSSCVQFKQYSNEFAISQDPPGYRWLSLEANGYIRTGVEIITGFDQCPDTNSTGY
jgi:Icc protein